MQLYQTWSNFWFGSSDLTWASLWERDALQRDLGRTVLSVHSPSYTLYPPCSEQLCNFSFNIFFSPVRLQLAAWLPASLQH